MNSNRYLEFDPHPELYDPNGDVVHAFMSPSVGSWIEDSRERFIDRYENYYAKTRGTEIHKACSDFLKIIEKYPDIGITGVTGNSTVSMFLKDAIKLHMKSEVPLRYSDICYGFADAVCYDLRKNILRIHDLKTGLVTPAKFRQLDIYAAILLLEYRERLQYQYDIDISQVQIEERIYQFDEVKVNNPSYEEIATYMDKIRLEHEWLSEELDRRNL